MMIINENHFVTSIVLYIFSDVYAEIRITTSFEGLISCAKMDLARSIDRVALRRQHCIFREAP